MDFSRAFYKANDGSVAYVINNVWDWVPQAPLSAQWPSEFTGRLLDSYSGSQKNPAVEEVLEFAANYSNVEAAFRQGLTRLHQLRGLGDAKLLKSLGRSFKGRHYRG